MDPFEDCLAKGRLKKIDTDAAQVSLELRASLDELERARTRFASGNWAEAATQGYFAIYRAGHAALLHRGYRDTNLYGLCAGLKRLYADSEAIAPETIDIVREAKDIKDVIYEGGRSSRHESRQVLLAAQVFVKRVLQVLELPEFSPEAVDFTLPDLGVRPRRRPPFPRDALDR